MKKKSNCTFRIYIDESGDEGFSFDKGSSEWFIISAIITKKAVDLKTVKLVDKIKVQLSKNPKQPLHFCDLKHEQRLPYIDEIARANLRAISVLIHKPTLHEPETFRKRYRLYFYTVRYLLERVSWYCRDHFLPHDIGDGSAEIYFSNRSGMSYTELKNYLTTLKNRTDDFDVRVDWSVIKENQIFAYSSRRRMGLQIADAVASGFFRAVQSSQYGYTESRYVEMLKPIVYNYGGRYLGYGIKFWPKEVDEKIQSEKNLKWVLKYYNGLLTLLSITFLKTLVDLA